MSGSGKKEDGGTMLLALKTEKEPQSKGVGGLGARKGKATDPSWEPPKGAQPPSSLRFRTSDLQAFFF